MGEAVLVNRKKFVSSLANELVEPFNELSKEIRGKGSLTIGETGQFRLFSPFFPCASREDVLE